MSTIEIVTIVIGAITILFLAFLIITKIIDNKKMKKINNKKD